MDGDHELDILFPDREVTVRDPDSGRPATLTVREFRFREGLEATAIARPFIAALAALVPEGAGESGEGVAPEGASRRKARGREARTSRRMRSQWSLRSQPMRRSGWSLPPAPATATHPGSHAWAMRTGARFPRRCGRRTAAFFCAAWWPGWRLGRRGRGRARPAPPRARHPRPRRPRPRPPRRQRAPDMAPDCPLLARRDRAGGRRLRDTTTGPKARTARPRVARPCARAHDAPLARRQASGTSARRLRDTKNAR